MLYHSLLLLHNFNALSMLHHCHRHHEHEEELRNTQRDVRMPLWYLNSINARARGRGARPRRGQRERASAHILEWLGGPEACLSWTVAYGGTRTKRGFILEYKHPAHRKREPASPAARRPSR